MIRHIPAVIQIQRGVQYFRLRHSASVIVMVTKDSEKRYVESSSGIYAGIIRVPLRISGAGHAFVLGGGEVEVIPEQEMERALQGQAGLTQLHNKRIKQSHS